MCISMRQGPEVASRQTAGVLQVSGCHGERANLHAILAGEVGRCLVASPVFCCGARTKGEESRKEGFRVVS